MGDNRSKHGRAKAKAKQKGVKAAAAVTPSQDPGEVADSAYNPAEQDAAPDTDDLTPPPEIPSKRTRRALSSDDETPLQKKSKGKKKAEKEAPDPDRRLVLMVPQANKDGPKRVLLTHSTSFDDALEIIHTTIGCTDVARKPQLLYKLSSALVKASGIDLETKTDWDGCLEDVTVAEAKKAVSVAIIVSDQYMASLRAARGGGRAKVKSKEPPPLLDLEHAESGDDDFDDGLGIMEKEKKCLEQLQKHHATCRLCGDSKACKIDRSGNHHHLTHAQLRGWARALVPAFLCSYFTSEANLSQASGIYDVTLVKPPRDELFSIFHAHGNRAAPGAQPAAAAGPSQMAAMQQMMGMPPYPYPYMPWASVPQFGHGIAIPGTPDTPTPVPRSSHSSSAVASALPSAFPSSDPPELDAVNPYPLISDFILRLDQHVPRRALPECLGRIEDQDFYHIDEIANLQTADALVEQFSLTKGNAVFLLGKICDEIKRVNRTRK
ncbi:hypothetical protein GGX14DRAFT_553279 [Mycena pura]|uniref:Uncharacterized protein n=1 Tax=Mycena pura TaxID=153505 RepID=A0AAD7E598_9AGAR|nr:hypothetical protein GGX14DRAFT_553279 [Mycena pura]